MELRDLFQPTACLQTSPLTSIETHTNGNSKSGLGALTTYNKVGSDNCGSLPMTHNNQRSSRGFYARIPPLDRSRTSSGLNLTVDSKQQKDSSESKLNALFDMYKVNLIKHIFSNEIDAYPYLSDHALIMPCIYFISRTHMKILSYPMA